MSCKQFRINLFAITVSAFVLPRFLNNDVSSAVFDYKQKAAKDIKKSGQIIKHSLPVLRYWIHQDPVLSVNP